MDLELFSVAVLATLVRLSSPGAVEGGEGQAPRQTGGRGTREERDERRTGGALVATGDTLVRTGDTLVGTPEGHQKQTNKAPR